MPEIWEDAGLVLAKLVVQDKPDLVHKVDELATYIKESIQDWLECEADAG